MGGVVIGGCKGFTGVMAEIKRIRGVKGIYGGLWGLWGAGQCLVATDPPPEGVLTDFLKVAD